MAQEATLGRWRRGAARASARCSARFGSASDLAALPLPRGVDPVSVGAQASTALCENGDAMGTPQCIQRLAAEASLHPPRAAVEQRPKLLQVPGCMKPTSPLSHPSPNPITSPQSQLGPISTRSGGTAPMQHGVASERAGWDWDGREVRLGRWDVGGAGVGVGRCRVHCPLTQRKRRWGRRRPKAAAAASAWTLLAPWWKGGSILSLARASAEREELL